MDKPVKRGPGRPRKSEIAAKKPGGRGKPGRPKGDAAIMADYKARMLASPKSEKVLETIFDAALTDEHRHQAAAWKLLMDRLLPVSMFDKEGGKKSPGVTINIDMKDNTSVNISEQDDVIDGEFTTHDGEN